VCRDTKAELDLIGPPTPQEVIAAAAGNIEKSLDGTSIHVAKYFEGTARRLLDDGVGSATTPAQVKHLICSIFPTVDPSIFPFVPTLELPSLVIS
jgi:hypothetical protein